MSADRRSHGPSIASGASLHPAEERMNDLPLRPAADIGAVEDRFFTLRNFPLADGTVMPKATIAYETYGRAVFDGRNAILCTHGCRRRMCHAGIAQSRIGRAPPSGTAAFALNRHTLWIAACDAALPLRRSRLLLDRFSRNNLLSGVRVALDSAEREGGENRADSKTNCSGA